MNSRKVWFAVSFATSLALQVHLYLAGRTDPIWPLFPLVVAWTAFLLPVACPVVLVERLFHFAPWDGDGHWLVTVVAMIVSASLVWFFPPRVARWFGTFDAVGDAGKRRLPSLSRGAAAVLDALTRLRIGKGKMGGWA